MRKTDRLIVSTAAHRNAIPRNLATIMAAIDKVDA